MHRMGFLGRSLPFRSTVGFGMMGLLVLGISDFNFELHVHEREVASIYHDGLDYCGLRRGIESGLWTAKDGNLLAFLSCN
jgi:hypothetical protein